MTSTHRAPEEAARLGVVIYDGVEPIDLGGTVGVLSMARRLLPGLAWSVIAERAGPVTLAGGLVVLAENGLADAPACDVLVVCGGPGWAEQTRRAPMLDFLRGAPDGGVASVCTGAMILAAAGRLDGREATTRRGAAPGEAQAPLALLSQAGALARAAALVEDRGVVTSGGVSLAIDGTLHLLGRLYGDDVRDAVARLIEYDRAWEANRAALGHALR